MNLMKRAGSCSRRQTHYQKEGRNKITVKNSVNILQENKPYPNQKMRPLYFKGTEDGQEMFIKVVIHKSVATVDMLIYSPDKSWTTRKKIFDLGKDDQHRDYSNFLERNFSSNYQEFDSARKQMLDASNDLEKPKETGEDSLGWRQEILKKITEFRKDNPDMDKEGESPC